MTKSKLFLIAAVAAATLASPAFAQSTMQSTHQERTLRSDQAQIPPGSNLYDGSQGDPNGSYYPGDN
jgi:opacity protein-like surface antigen